MSEEVKVFTKDDKIAGDEVFAIFSKRVFVGDEAQDYRSYEANNIRMYVNKDGSLCLSDYNSEGFIFLYPDQLEHLKKALDVAIKQRATA